MVTLLNRSITKLLHRPRALALKFLLVTCIVVLVCLYNSYLTFDTKSSFETRYITNVSRRLPQCVIIGVRKGGSRALIEFLSMHPGIRTTGREVHFFDVEKHYQQGYEWYRNKMPHSYPGQITMEKTPSYFREELVPGRIHKMNASLKLLLIVRDPIQRLISDYTHSLSSRIAYGKRVFQFEHLAINQSTGVVNENYRPVGFSIYHQQMSNWLRYFSLSQFHIVDGERLITDPLSELEAVELFLGLAPKISENQFYFNETRRFYCVIGTYRDPCLSGGKGRPHPQIRQSVIKTLKQFFSPHNEIFFKQIGRRFSW